MLLAEQWNIENTVGQSTTEERQKMDKYRRRENEVPV
jgi:hypothetical protein